VPPPPLGLFLLLPPLLAVHQHGAGIPGAGGPGGAGVPGLGAALAAALAPVHAALAALAPLPAAVAGLQADVAGLQAHVAALAPLPAAVAGLQADVAGIQADVAGLQAHVAALAPLPAAVAGIQADVAGLVDHMHRKNNRAAFGRGEGRLSRVGCPQAGIPPPPPGVWFPATVAALNAATGADMAPLLAHYQLPGGGTLASRRTAIVVAISTP
jgi:hypothetical protein